MAGRSLGALTVDLVLKNGGFSASMDKSARDAEKSLKRIQSTTRGIKTAFGVLAGFVSLREIIAASAEAAKNFALLENAVKQAGDAAGGRSARDFAAVSDQLQAITTFSDDAVQGVQQLLLRFQSIRTDRFDEATKSVLDLATAMGTDADAAAKLLGRALTDPEKGMTALARAGVVFSDQQKKVIKDLVDTGRQAEAQGIILDELSKKFGGAAEAARNNFAGALAGVKNAFDNLLEVDGGLPEATKQLNELSKVLSDPGTKAGADALFSGIVVGATAAASGVAKLTGGIRLLVGGDGGNEQVDLDREIDRLLDLKKDFERAMAPGLRRETGGFFGLLMSAGEARKQLEGLNQQIEELQKLQQEIQDNGGKRADAIAPTSAAFVLPDITTVDNTEALAKAAEKARKELEAMGEALTKSLQTPLDKYNTSVAEADRLLTAGVISIETWAQALGAARGDLDALNSGMLEVNERFKDMNQVLEESLEHFDEDLFGGLTEMEPPDISEALEKVDTELSVFADQAARNTQDIIADGLVNGFDDGIKGMLDSFADMLVKLAAQAVAADIAGKIFGDSQDGSSGGGGGGGGGWLGAFMDYFTKRDSGGRGQAGVPYMIGTGAQPEFFVPDSAGEFYPKGSYGAGTKLTQNIFVQGQVTERTAKQLSLDTQRRQRQAQRLA